MSQALGTPICSRPISTAPRDGTQILAYAPPGSHRFYSEADGQVITRKKRGQFMLVRWFPGGPGYWSTHHKGVGKVEREPTLWAPLFLHDEESQQSHDNAPWRPQ